MSNERPSARYLRRIVVGTGLALPTLSLIPFGSYWLWQNGYLLYWGAAACATTGAAFLYQRTLLKPRAIDKAIAGAEENRPEAHWSPGEEQAWQAVLDLAERSEPKHLASRDEAINLALRTIETVARRLHPEVDDPLWQFTVPEALALIENVSERMRPMIVDNVPLGDRLTVAQLLSLYRWRGAIDVANRAYDVWRVLRLVNPVAAATQEARERLTRQMLDWGKDQVARRIVKTYVREVGRSAIDLYGGRLRVVPVSTPASVPVDGSPASAPPGRVTPIKLIIAGQDAALLTNIMHQLATESRFYTTSIDASGNHTVEIERDGLSEPLLMSTVVSDAGSTDEVKELATADIIIYASGSDAPAPTAQQLDRVRAHFARQPSLSAPAAIAVFERPNQGVVDEQSVLSRLSAAVALPHERIVLIAQRDNIELSRTSASAVWSAIEHARADAKRVQLLRSFAQSKNKGQWGRMFRQVRNAGRSIAEHALSRSSK